jgi:DNA-3-methyladenine glycosylase I
MKEVKTIRRCDWVNQDPIYIDYHDNEWGKPLRDNQKLFELFILEGFQAGLSWITVLKKRAHFREVFDGFNPTKISKYSDQKIQELLNDSGIIRNRLKVKGAIINATLFLEMEKEALNFSQFVWSFVNNQSIINQYKSHADIPVTTPEAEAMSKALKKRGFKFCGPTICYAFMQASGMVNDHTAKCFLSPM